MADLLGVPRNPHALNVHHALMSSAEQLGVPVRAVDLTSLRAAITGGGESRAFDRDGPVEVRSLAPFLLFGYPAAVTGLRVILRTAYGQNPVEATLLADDKAATAIALAEARVPQVPTEVLAADLEQVRERAAAVGYPVILKRTHGAQGRWVRRAADSGELAVAFQELMADGPGALVLQPEVTESRGRSVRVVITDLAVLAVTERSAAADGWLSNIAQGSDQRPVALTPTENRMALDACAAVGLRHAGVDILRSAAGSQVLEVNACPDFTSMVPFFADDLTARVVRACLAR